MTAWDKVQKARELSRPSSYEYINNIFEDFIELHGDRAFADDKSFVCGIGKLEGMSVTIIAEQRGRNVLENVERNFGMPNPEGYRKALRLMKQAEKFHRPIITFIDTKGAYPGLGAEERGQGEAIARNLISMFQLKVPIIVVVIGEGSSGGALAIGIGDKVFMLENAIYSILSPEGYASILWKDASKAREAAESMKLTAEDLYAFGMIDEIIPEEGERIYENLKEKLVKEIKDLKSLDIDTLLENRYLKYRNIKGYKEKEETLNAEG